MHRADVVCCRDRCRQAIAAFREKHGITDTIYAVKGLLMGKVLVACVVTDLCKSQIYACHRSMHVCEVISERSEGVVRIMRNPEVLFERMGTVSFRFCVVPSLFGWRSFHNVHMAQ